MSSEGCKGVVEPDGGSDFPAGSKAVILVKYTSPDNKPPRSVKAFTDFGATLDNIADPAETFSLTRLTSPATVERWTNVPNEVKTLIQNDATLFDGNFTNGEVYFAEVAVFGPSFNILRIEADDGIQSATPLNNWTIPQNGCVEVQFTDGDGDGVEDAEETNPNDPAKITLSQESSESGKNKKVECNVERGDPNDTQPMFTPGSRPCTLTNINGKLATTPVPNLSMIGCLELKAFVDFGKCAKFSLTLPEPLPVGARIFKLNSFGAWIELTNTNNLTISGRTLTYPVCDGDTLDFDGQADGVVTDPIGIFGAGGGGVVGGGVVGGGGGCYINPRFNRTDNNNFDSSMLILLATLGLYALYRLNREYSKRRLNI